MESERGHGLQPPAVPLVAGSPARPRRWQGGIRAAFLLLALGFLGFLVASQWRELRGYEWRPAVGWALLGIAGLELAFLMQVAAWRYLLGRLGGRLSYRRALRAWFVSNLVRYIPGNVWQFLSMAELAADDGVPRLATFSTTALLQVLGMGSGGVLAAVYYGLTGSGVLLGTLRYGLLLLPLGLLLSHPRFLERGMNVLLRLVRRPPIRVTLTWPQVLGMLALYAIIWGVMGVAFAALVRAFIPIPASQVVPLMAAWAAAYVIGYLSLLTPSGLGVRESALVLLLGPHLPVPLPAVIAMAARLWMITAEMLAVAAIQGLTLVRHSGQHRR